LIAAINAYDQAAREHKAAVAERRALRTTISKRVRTWHQTLYSYVGRESPILADYGF